MAKVVVKDISALGALLGRIVNHALNDEVAPNVQADFAEQAQIDVYDKYDPFVYDRSYSLVQDIDTYQIEQEGETKISISVNHPHGELIEYGHGEGGYYEYPYNRDDTAWKFLNPRPFYRHTVEKLQDGRFKELLKDALKEYGLNVK